MIKISFANNKKKLYLTINHSSSGEKSAMLIQEKRTNLFKEKRNYANDYLYFDIRISTIYWFVIFYKSL